MTETAEPPFAAQVLKRLDAMDAKIERLVQLRGERMTREDFCLRLGIDRKTFKKRMDLGQIPRPQSDGKWFLSEVMEWEARKVRHF
jgi:predicted DNA-binding transcriptional regulator AlpA